MGRKRKANFDNVACKVGFILFITNMYVVTFFLPFISPTNISAPKTNCIMDGMAPTYISELLHIYKPARPLRSAYQNLLVIPRSVNNLDLAEYD